MNPLDLDLSMSFNDLERETCKMLKTHNCYTTFVRIYKINIQESF